MKEKELVENKPNHPLQYILLSVFFYLLCHISCHFIPLCNISCPRICLHVWSLDDSCLWTLGVCAECVQFGSDYICFPTFDTNENKTWRIHMEEPRGQNGILFDWIYTPAIYTFIKTRITKYTCSFSLIAPLVLTHRAVEPIPNLMTHLLLSNHQCYIVPLSFCHKLWLSIALRLASVIFYRFGNVCDDDTELCISSVCVFLLYFV